MPRMRCGKMTGSENPVSNTGSISTTSAASLTTEADSLHADLRAGRKLVVSLHWLTATTKQLDITDAVAFVTDYLGYAPDYRPTGQLGYSHVFEWLGGLKLLDHKQRPEMGICLLADGEACDHYGFDKLSYIYQALQFNATRLDLAVDGCRFHPALLRSLWIADHVRSSARSPRGALPGRERVRSNKWFSSPSGDTFYMGSRPSSQYARCYNARGYTRFEMELKKARASQTMAALCDGADMSATLGAAISQFVMFTDQSDENRSRCRVLPFWARFIARLSNSGAITRLAGAPERSLDRLVSYIENQVAPSLAVYEILMGRRDDYDEVRRNLRRIGLENAKPKHMAMVKQFGGWLVEHDSPQYLKTKSKPKSLLEQNALFNKHASA